MTQTILIAVLIDAGETLTTTELARMLTNALAATGHTIIPLAPEPPPDPPATPPPEPPPPTIPPPYYSLSSETSLRTAPRSDAPLIATLPAGTMFSIRVPGLNLWSNITTIQDPPRSGHAWLPGWKYSPVPDYTP